MEQLFQELQRRNMVRVAVGYVIVGWVLIQVASILLPTFDAPGWVLQVFVLFVVMGFWLALVLAWAYGDPPEGAEQSAPPALTQRHVATDVGLVAAVVLLLGFSVFSYMNPRNVTVVAADNSANASIAVLAFDDLSQGGTQVHFAEGISEEILNALAQVPELRVAARTSSFSFRDSNATIQEIGERLSVSHVLEGSVRISGDNMRITAQLIEAATGFHAWSETYDRRVEDIFAIQDEVTNLILAALNDEMGTDFDVVEHDQGTANVAAYNAYLLGRHQMQQREAESMRLAVSAYEQAIALDPLYADAWAGIGRAYYLNYEAFTDEEVAEHMRPALVEAIALNPDNAIAIATLALVNLGFGDEAQTNILEGMVLARRAYELAPDDIEIRMTYVNSLMSAQRYRDAFAVLQGILDEDPNFPPAISNMMNVYFALGRQDLGYPLFVAQIEGAPLTPDTVNAYIGLAFNAFRLDDQEMLSRIDALFAAQTDPIYVRNYELFQKGVQGFQGITGPMEEWIEAGHLDAMPEVDPNWGFEDVAIVYAISGLYDEAFENYHRSIDSGNYEALYHEVNAAPVDPEFFDDPRWHELLSRPETAEAYRLHRIAEEQGQWEPLTDEEVGIPTN